MQKIHVHQNFWRHKYYFQTVWQIAFVRGSPAQKTRTGYTADLQQYPGVARLKEMPTGSGTTDSSGLAVWGPPWTRCSKWLRSTKVTLWPKVCTNWGVLHCFREKTWQHTLTSSQLPHIPTDTLASSAENLKLKAVRGWCYESVRPWSGQAGRYNNTARCNSPAAKALPTSSFH